MKNLFKIKLFDFKNYVPTKKYLNWLKNPNIHKYTQIKKKQTFKKLKKYIEINKKDKNVDFFRICLKKKRFIHIGNIRVSYKNDTASVALIIGEQKYWNLGLGTQSLELIKKHTKKKNIKLLNAFIHKENLPSIKIFKKAGFKFNKLENWILKL